MPTATPLRAQAPVALARQAYYGDADPQRCVELCRTLVAHDADERQQLILMQCRALIRLYDYQGALDLLDGHAADLHGPHRLMARLQRATVLIRRGAVEHGLAALHALRAEAAGAPPSLKSELALAIALAQYCRRDFERVEEALREIGPSDGVDYARTFMYRGYVAVQRNDYREAVALFKRALDEQEHSTDRDLAMDQNVVAAMSLIAIELLDGELWSYVEERAERYQLFAPGTVYAKFVFQYTRSIHAETHGRPRDALLAARDAARTASTAQERLLALCRRATVLLRYGERLAYDDLAVSIRERFHALEPRSVSNWEVTAVPLAVAEVLALMGDVAGACSAAEFAMNRAMPSTDDWSAPTDAYRSHVAGMLAEAKGQSFQAQHCYRRAFQRYADLGFAHRAMVVALHITKSNKDPALLGYLRRHSRGLLADSWIVRRCAALGALEQDAVLARLSSAEREVLALLVDGCSTAEIAARRNRTVQTVRNTISRLNHAFGVDNRQALVRECVRRKLFSAG